jgi:cytochrome c-type biogenesis protein CcmH/NrfG
LPAELPIKAIASTARRPIVNPPSPADDLVLLGEAQLLDDQVEDAELSFLQATRLDPENRNASLGLGHALVARGDFSDALLQFVKLVERDPSDIEAQAGILECLGVKPLALSYPADTAPVLASPPRVSG